MKPILIIGHDRPLSKVMFSYTGDMLFTSCLGGKLNGWDAEDGTLLKRYTFTMNDKAVEKAIWHFDVTYDGDRIIVAGAVGVFILDVITGEQKHCLKSDQICRCVEWNKKPDNQTQFVVVTDSFVALPSSITKYALEQIDDGKEVIKEKLVITNFPERCTGASWGPFDATIISWHSDGSLHLWDAETGAKLAEAQYFTGTITDVDFNHDRTCCLCASVDKSLVLLQTWSLEKIQTYTVDRPINTCALSPLWRNPDPTKNRPHFMAAGGQSAEEVTTTKTHEGKVEPLLVNGITGEILGHITGNFSPIRTICFFPDGTGFASGAEEGNVRIYKFDPSYWNDPIFQ